MNVKNYTYLLQFCITFTIFSTNIFIALLMVISAVALSAAFAGMVLALIKVHRLYRGAGFSIDKARKEFSDGVMADRHVQQVLHFSFEECRFF